MELKLIHFKHIMYFYFKKGKNAAEVTRKVVNIYGKDAVNESTVRRWSAKFS